MRKRKTIEVKKVKEWANTILVNSADSEIEKRKGVAQAIQFVLLETENYNGFSLLTEKTMAKSLWGQSPGVKDGEILDDSRRCYF